MLPPDVGLYITNYCTLKCSHCFFNLNNELNTAELGWEDILTILDDAQKNKVFLLRISGGDPLLHKDILKIISETKKRKILPLIGATGTNINSSLAQKLNKAGLPSVQVSLDGATEATNAFFRGEKTHFSETLASIKTLQEAGLKVNIAICLDKNNYQDIDALLQLARDYNIYKLKVQFWWKSASSKISQTKHIELNQEEKSAVIEKCRLFERKNHLKDWAIVSDIFPSAHYPPLVITAHGGFHIGEYGPFIGHIKRELPSEAYSKFMTAKVQS